MTLITMYPTMPISNSLSTRLVMSGLASLCSVPTPRNRISPVDQLWHHLIVPNWLRPLSWLLRSYGRQVGDGFPVTTGRSCDLITLALIADTRVLTWQPGHEDAVATVPDLRGRHTAVLTLDDYDGSNSRRYGVTLAM